jgi:hypothetical protein
MWLLAGCHLFSSAAIDATCEDVGACDETGDGTPPLLGDPERTIAALACGPCGANPDLGAQYVADVWLVPDTGRAFPQLAQPTEWSGPVAYDPRDGIAFVATGGTVVVLGPRASDLAPFTGLVDGAVVAMVARDGAVVLSTSDRVYRWDPSQGRDGLVRVQAGEDGEHAFDHLFLDPDGTVWAADVAQDVDLWAVGQELSLEVEALANDPELVSAGMFVGRDGAFSGCDHGGAVFELDGGAPVPLGRPPGGGAVGCGYDPGLGGHVVLDAERGALFQPDGADAWSPYAAPPNGGHVLVGSIVP